jgi:hypothetical protein
VRHACRAFEPGGTAAGSLVAADRSDVNRGTRRRSRIGVREGNRIGPGRTCDEADVTAACGRCEGTRGQPQVPERSRRADTRGGDRAGTARIRTSDGRVTPAGGGPRRERSRRGLLTSGRSVRPCADRARPRRDSERSAASDMRRCTVSCPASCGTCRAGAVDPRQGKTAEGRATAARPSRTTWSRWTSPTLLNALLACCWSSDSRRRESRSRTAANSSPRRPPGSARSSS